MSQIALVTGSSRGIGRQIAIQLAQGNFTVIINGRSEKDVVATCREIQILGGEAVPFVGDLTIEAEIKKAYDFIQLKYMKLDLLVCNIGGSSKTPNQLSVNVTEWKRIFDLNFFSTVAAVDHMLPLLEKTAGHIICISSMAAVEKMHTAASYAVAKAALISYCKQLMRSLAEKKIRINTVSPGNVWFEGGSWDKKLKDNPILVNELIQNSTALKKFVTPEEVADTVLFLQKNSSMTGQNILVDAGFTRQA